MAKKIVVNSTILNDKSPQCLRYMVDNLIDENMILRGESTRLKLVMHQIIEDLEKGKGNEKYVKWIKNNCNIELYNDNDIEKLNEINKKRTLTHINKTQYLKKLYQNANHSYECNTILRIAEHFGYEWW